MSFLRIDTVCVKVNTLMSQLDNSAGHTVAAVPRPDPLLCGCDHLQAEQQRWRAMVGMSVITRLATLQLQLGPTPSRGKTTRQPIRHQWKNGIVNYTE